MDERERNSKIKNETHTQTNKYKTNKQTIATDKSASIEIGPLVFVGTNHNSGSFTHSQKKEEILVRSLHIILFLLLLFWCTEYVFRCRCDRRWCRRRCISSPVRTSYLFFVLFGYYYHFFLQPYLFFRLCRLCRGRWSGMNFIHVGATILQTTTTITVPATAFYNRLPSFFSFHHLKPFLLFAHLAYFYVNFLRILFSLCAAAAADFLLFVLPNRLCVLFHFVSMLFFFGWRIAVRVLQIHQKWVCQIAVVVTATSVCLRTCKFVRVCLRALLVMAVFRWREQEKSVR